MAGFKIKSFIQKTQNYLETAKFIFFYNVFERLTFFAFYVSIARYIDKEIFGFVVAVFALTNIVIALFDFGIPFYIQRESAFDFDAKSILIQSIYLKFILLIIFLLIPFLYFIKNVEYWLIIITISLINFFNALNQILVAYLNGRNKFKENFFSIFYSRTPYFLLLILITIFKIDIHIVLFLVLLTLIIQLKFLLKFSDLSLISFIESRVEFSKIKLLLKNSYPFGLGLIFVMMYDRIDVLLIQKFLNNESVAIYSAAYSLYRNSSILSGIIILRVYNEFSKFFKEYRQIDLLTLKTSGLIVVSLSLILILIFIYGGEILIKLFYSYRFIQSAEVLRLVSFAIPFMFLNNLTGVLLNSIHKEKISMLTTFLGLIINVILNLNLIPVYKLNGAVFATIGTEGFIFLIQGLFIYLFIKKIKN